MRQTEKLKTGTDERKSKWVRFHDGHDYLLPVVSRFNRVVPVFDDDGTMRLEVEAKDPEVESLVNQFLDLVATVDVDTIWFQTQETYEQFFRLITRLLNTNYAMNNAELTVLLTVDSAQMEVLFDTVMRHILGRHQKL